MANPEFETLENPQESNNSTLETTRFGKGKVFSRENTAVLESTQAWESNLDPKNEETMPNPLLQAETESHMSNNNHDLSIVVGKGTRECIKRPLYSLAHFLPLKKIHHLIEPC